MQKQILIVQELLVKLMKQIPEHKKIDLMVFDLTLFDFLVIFVSINCKGCQS